MRRTLFAFASLLTLTLVACGGEGEAPGRDGRGEGGQMSGGGGDSPTASGGGYGKGAGGDGGAAPSGTAPDGALPGEHPAVDGENAVEASPSADAVLRVDALPGEHIGFHLGFDESFDDVELELVRWDGAMPVALGFTDAGPGLRTLAAFDAGGPRTFWVRVRSAEPDFAGTLTVTRTPFQDGSTCPGDCERLLQLPMRNDPKEDGYDWTPSTIFRYQFARRDLLMFVRHAARTMALSGREPIFPEDFSQWDGETPGTDTGGLRHASHQRGKDVDISLYGTDGSAMWRSFCDVEYGSDGRACVPGSATGFDGLANAELYGAFLVSGRVTMSFLDRELIPYVRDGAEEAADADALDPTLLPLYSDGVHLQHWPNHDNHIHVRVSELDYGDSAVAAEPFEAP